MQSAGFVLTGGRSSRMGRDKAFLPYGESTLAAHVARQVLLATGSVSLVGSPERYAEIGFPVVPDLYPGEGPLGGILTALAVSEAPRNLVVACDMPSLEAAYLIELLDFAARHPAADCVAPRPPGGRPEPLCAVYNASARAKLESLFASGVRKLQLALQPLRTVYHEIEDSRPFSNMNTPEDWESHRAHRPDRR